MLTGWETLLAAARAPAEALHRAAADPGRAQEDLLRSILTAHEGSACGRRHGFSHIAGLADYRRRVPIVRHEDIAGAVAAIAAGQTNVLTAAPVVAFEETGGSGGGRKLVPHTAASLASFRAAVLPWLEDLARRRPGIASGRAYVPISPVLRAPGCTAGGIPVGLGSDAAYLGADLAGAFASVLAVTPDVAAAGDVEGWRRETLRQLVEAEDLAFVSIWSPTFLLLLLDALPGEAEALLPRLGPAAAARLRQALRGGGLDTPCLWPRLDTVSCWADGPSRPFAERLAALLPQAFIEPKGLIATEAAVTIAWQGGEGAIPALTSTVIEFIDAAGESHLADGLREGEAYRVVITTSGGLYRYDLGDQLRCVGVSGRLPRLRFEGRAGLASDLVGEKLTDAFVGKALCELPFDAALAPVAGAAPHYRLIAATAAVLDPAIAARVEAALRANPQYAYARDLGQLGALRPAHVPSFRAGIMAVRLAAGDRLGDLKPQALLTGAQAEGLANLGGRTDL